MCFDQCTGFVAAHGRQGAGEDEGLARKHAFARVYCFLDEPEACGQKLFDDFAVVRFAEEIDDALRDDGSDIVDGEQGFEIGVHQCMNVAKATCQVFGRGLADIAYAKCKNETRQRCVLLRSNCALQAQEWSTAYQRHGVRGNTGIAR